MLLYLNQPVKINFNIGIDTSLTYSIVLKYKKPSGATGEFTDIQVSNPTAGECYYEVLNDELDEVGAWSLWSLIETDGGLFPGSPINLTIRAEGGGIVSRETVKAYLGITGTEYDDMIDMMIPITEQSYLDIRNVPFALGPDGITISYPTGSDITASEMIGYKLSTNKFASGTPFGAAKQSESIDAYSISYGDVLNGSVGGYPKSITSAIKRYCDGR